MIAFVVIITLKSRIFKRELDVVKGTKFLDSRFMEKSFKNRWCKWERNKLLFHFETDLRFHGIALRNKHDGTITDN
jgi:hypothetical protein